ncbi:MAG: capsular biosynthesis protein [Cyclobacteriaceae bacterium]
MFWFQRSSFDLKTDVHSHLIPGVDDGVKSTGESIKILRFLNALGYQRIITTPHIYPEAYPNTEEELTSRFHELGQLAATELPELKIELAAEYFVHEELLEKVKSGKKLLCFGGNYVLIETAFHVKPMIWDELIFEMQVAGYKPVLAHPERYEYLIGKADYLKHLKQRGVLLQVSLPSLIKAYGIHSYKLSRYLVKNGMIDFLGSDIHNLNQLKALERSLKSKLLKKISTGSLINDKF